ncbi:MAG: tRNA (adenosine(37)-N6)-threonylcarbamoyltransferase complex dimerization subunit type 1 TsaB [Clostridia bacterium]|jgi:tRNA threonylcarbamoyladenosine biosynthesis protein TsaB|nr:tRNA (adenosine(37)-N6)-threonylcarbamoyltransferase complex dimerization subunit type 1 TsaB [Clostridia bacterium]
MLVLGIDSSTPVASAAIVSAEGLIGEITLNIGLTHSEQLLPMIDELFRQTRTTLGEMGGIAVAGGPGSFTGLRIGMATAKGLAQGGKIPLVSVPGLQALAWRHAGLNGLISPVLNARRQEVYAALFRSSQGDLEQLAEDCAVSPRDWAQILNKYAGPVLFCGDGAQAFRQEWSALLGERAVFLPPALTLNNAVTVAHLGREKLAAGQADDLYTLKPSYIRMSEAQVRLCRQQAEPGR